MTQVKKYRKKPIVIEAIQCKEPNNLIDITDFCPVSKIGNGGETGLEWVTIKTLEGEMIASYGDYIIKGIQGEFYPCKPDIFEQTYELATQEPTHD